MSYEFAWLKCTKVCSSDSRASSVLVARDRHLADAKTGRGDRRSVVHVVGQSVDALKQLVDVE